MKKSILILLLVTLIFGFIAIYPVLFQEGNPVPILKGIVKLSFSDDKIVQISDKPKIYISKTTGGNTLLIELLKQEGWRFVEQLGSGYMFVRDDIGLIVESTQYTGKYTIWKYSRGTVSID